MQSISGTSAISVKSHVISYNYLLYLVSIDQSCDEIHTFHGMKLWWLSNKVFTYKALWNGVMIAIWL